MTPYTFEREQLVWRNKCDARVTTASTTHQSINQSINRSIKQKVPSHSINQSIHDLLLIFINSTNQAINRSINLSVPCHSKYTQSFIYVRKNFEEIISPILSFLVVLRRRFFFISEYEEFLSYSSKINFFVHGTKTLKGIDRNLIKNAVKDYWEFSSFHAKSKSRTNSILFITLPFFREFS